MDPHRWTQEPSNDLQTPAGHKCRIRRYSSWTLIVGSVPTGLKSLQTTCKLQLDIDVGSADIVHGPSSLVVFQLDSSTCKFQLDIGVGSPEMPALPCPSLPCPAQSCPALPSPALPSPALPSVHGWFPRQASWQAGTPAGRRAGSKRAGKQAGRQAGRLELRTPAGHRCRIRRRSS